MFPFLIYRHSHRPPPFHCAYLVNEIVDGIYAESTAEALQYAYERNPMHDWETLFAFVQGWPAGQAQVNEVRAKRDLQLAEESWIKQGLPV